MSEMNRKPAPRSLRALSLAPALSGLLAAACGASSEPRPGPLDQEPPSAPAGLTATAEADGRVNLTWQASTDNVGVTGYQVMRDASRVGTTTDTKFSDSGLAVGTRHCYFVVAYDLSGNTSPPSSEKCALLSDMEPPTAPSGLTASSGGVGQINLRWTAASDDVGVVSYRVTRDDADLATTAELFYGDSGLVPGSQHCYLVTAQDAAGNTSSPSSKACAESGKDSEAPSAPTSLIATQASATEIDLTWMPSTDNLAVLGYEVLRDGSKIATATTPAYADKSFAAGRRHCYTVRAVDAAANVSAASNEACAGSDQDTTPPTQPQGLTATTGATGAIDLSWTASTDDRGVVGYTIYRDGAVAGSATGASYSDSGLVPAARHCYTVTANDEAGNASTPSKEACATAGLDVSPPGVVKAAAATGAAAGQIDVSWEAATDDVGVAGYKVTRDGKLLATLAAEARSHGDSGLVSGSTHCYLVQAFDAAQNLSATGDAVCAPARSTVPLTRLPVATGNILPWSVAAAQGGYLVAIQKVMNGSGGGPIGGAVQLLDIDGGRLGTPVSLSSTARLPMASSDGQQYFVVWAEQSSARRLVGQRFSSAAAPVGGQVAIGQMGSTGGYEPWCHGLAYGGGDYLAVWAEPSDGKVYGQFISAAGSLKGWTIPISSTRGANPTVTGNASGDFLVAWDGLTSARAKLVSAAGPKTDEVVLASKPSCPTYFAEGNGPKMTALGSASSGSGHLVVWSQAATSNCSGRWEIAGRLVDGSGTPQGGTLSFAGADDAQVFPSVAYDGSNFLVVWSGASGSTSIDVHGQYVSPAGAPVGSMLPLTASSEFELFTPLVFGHGKYFVIWGALRSLSSDPVFLGAHGGLLTP